MKKRIIIVSWCIIFVVFVSFMAFLNIKRVKDTSAFDINTLGSIINDGDIVFRRGIGIVSDTIVNLSINDKRFSHVGIARKDNEQVFVIHAEGHSNPKKSLVKEETLQIFLKNAVSVGIYRIDRFDSGIVSEIAYELLGVPFDFDFDEDDERKLYCTELIYVILKRLYQDAVLNTIWVNEINKSIIPIDAVSQSEYLFEIGYFKKEVK